MRYKNLLHFVVATLTLLTLFWSVSSGHVMTNASSMPHQEMSNCQSVCPPLLNEKQKTPQVDDAADPDPFSPAILSPMLSQTTIYAVLFSTLALLFLQRRPPDKLALNSIYRI